MMIELSLLIGLSGIIIVIVGGYIVRDRQIVKMISINDSNVKMQLGELHKHIAATYARSGEMDRHLGRIESSVSELSKEIREERRDTNQRLDTVLQVIAPSSGKSK